MRSIIIFSLLLMALISCNEPAASDSKTTLDTLGATLTKETADNKTVEKATPVEEPSVYIIGPKALTQLVADKLGTDKKSAQLTHKEMRGKWNLLKNKDVYKVVTVENRLKRAERKMNKGKISADRFAKIQDRVKTRMSKQQKGVRIHKMNNHVKVTFMAATEQEVRTMIDKEFDFKTHVYLGLPKSSAEAKRTVVLVGKPEVTAHLSKSFNKDVDHVVTIGYDEMDKVKTLQKTASHLYVVVAHTPAYSDVTRAQLKDLKRALGKTGPGKKMGRRNLGHQFGAKQAGKRGHFFKKMNNGPVVMTSYRLQDNKVWQNTFISYPTESELLANIHTHVSN